MTRRVALVAALFAAAAGPALDPGPARAQAPAVPLQHPTPAERSRYEAFTAPGEIVPYLAALAKDVEGVTVDSLAAPAPLPIVRLDARPEQDSQGPVPVRVLVIGAQHGTERAGLESALRLARDLAVGPLSHLRRRLEVRIVPMANPWGVQHRSRETGGGVDLDRDHVRLAAPETRALWAEYAAWRPHLVLDLHELGPGEYGLQAGVPTHPNAPGSTRVSRFYLLPFAANRLARADIRFHEYVAPWLDGATAEASARPAPDSIDAGRTWFTPPPLDPASARNAFALAGSAVLYLATPSSRDILGLHERTDRMHVAVTALLEAAAALGPDLDAAFRAASELPKGELALRVRYAEGDATAAVPWLIINERGQSEQVRLTPWRPAVEVEASLPTPSGWWIDPEAASLIENLRSHGFTVGSEPLATRETKGSARVEPESPMAYLGCGPGELRSDRPPPGALWVDADQPGGRLLFTLVEPWSAGGWFACDREAAYPVWRAPR